MVAIPAGRVRLSDRRTQSSWSVEVPPYEMAAFPITQPQYAQVTGQRPSTARGDRLPVESVSWWDAIRFCNALSHREGLTPAYRLRAEVEGVEWDASVDGYRLPNAWGLCDMLGNVWDWCWDVYDAEVYGTYRVLRGGGWSDEHWSCRASVRRRSYPTFQIDDVGFRIARSTLP